ncbi:DUF2752 domain-containing protein [Oerskovia sp. Sa1BUA8]|uniref:DUF2752 domain-containing protein n=1 Tax=Oerskovia douganii TaxID=2762210 RepID=A0A9D5UBS6_9CELL|nr:DUF2752 domain-containing protein [Oerskovia douganii]MBE7702015.1 DUF2752 domain-containing protein [Oerskovia douganii]
MSDPPASPRAPSPAQQPGEPSSTPAVPDPPGWRALRAPLAVGAGVAGATLVLALVDPHEGGYPLCPLLALTGWACPACGGLRATHDLATGDLAGAWAMNPLWVLVVPVLVLAWALWVRRSWRGTRARPVPVWVGILGLVVLIGFGIARNVPALVPFLGPS